MANSVVNENIIKPAADGAQKFVDLKGLDYFWSKAQAYVDAADKVAADKVAALEGVVGDDSKGLVKEVAALRTEVDALGGGEGGIQGMIDATITKLDLPNTYDAKGAADDALEVAKTYTDGKVDGKFDAAGSAAAAEAAAKAYADEKVAGAVGVYASEGVEASGLRKEIAERDAAVLAAAKEYTDGKDSTMSGRVAKLEAIDHNKLAADAAADAVATVVGGAPEAFDTLKEIADWIQKDAANENGFDAAARIVALESGKADKTYVDGLNTTMSGRVDVLEAIDHDAYIAADAALKSELSGAIATAKSEAIADAEDKVNTMAATLRGEIATAKSEAVSEANGHADSVAATAKSEAISDAKDYTDNALKSYTKSTDMEAAIAAAKQAAIDAAQAKIDALTTVVEKKADITYVDVQVAGAKAHAETYTNALFNSITFATNTEIDSIF